MSGHDRVPVSIANSIWNEINPSPSCSLLISIYRPNPYFSYLHISLIYLIRAKCIKAVYQLEWELDRMAPPLYQ